MDFPVDDCRKLNGEDVRLFGFFSIYAVLYLISLPLPLPSYIILFDGKCESYYIFSGKHEWPELVGFDGNLACKIIEEENPEVYTAIVKERGMVVTMDYICKRVRVWVDNDTNLVTRIPTAG